MRLTEGLITKRGRRNPNVIIARGAFEDITRGEQELGLSPLTRHKVFKVRKPKAELKAAATYLRVCPEIS
jgi:phage terminase small subunit